MVGWIVIGWPSGVVEVVGNLLTFLLQELLLIVMGRVNIIVEENTSFSCRRIANLRPPSFIMAIIVLLHTL